MLAPNHYFPPFSKEEYERRYRALREEMEAAELDCLIVYGATHLGGNDTGSINVQYLSNFTGVGHSYVLLPLKEEPTLFIVVLLHQQNARDIGCIQDVQGGERLEQGLCARLKELNLEKGRIGIVGSSVSFFMPCTIPYEHRLHLQQELPKAEFVNVHEWYENIRSIKSEEEISLLERAAALNDLCHEEVVHATRPGASHADLRRVVEQVAWLHKGNHCMMHLSSWPMSNQDWPYPDFWPTNRTVDAGHLVMTEMPVGYGMYYTKIMGSYFVGRPTREYEAMFELAAGVHERIIRELKPGMKGSDVDRFAEPLREAGYMTAGMVSGWSNYNGPPFVGQTNPDFPSPQKPSHLNLVFKPGLCVQVMVYPIALDLSRSLWIGSTCLFVEGGLRELNRYGVRELRVV
jgi:Xaa-Pro aminopeptidase